MKYPEINSITVIGAGGTGSFFLHHLARFLKGHNLKLTVNIYDGDIVESERNLLRSPVLHISDMEMHKAEVIAKRLNLWYGLESFRYFNFFLDSEEFENPQFLYESNLIITCTDSIKLRKNIDGFFSDLYGQREYYLDDEHRKFWCDCGNETNYGQVYMGWSRDNIPSSQWPNFRKARDGRSKNGCSLQPFEKQGPVTNDRAALGAMLLIEPLLLKQEYKFRAYYFGEYGSKIIKTRKEDHHENCPPF